MCAGFYQPGDTVEIRLELLEDELEVTGASFCYEDIRALEKWSDKSDSLNEGLGEIDMVKSSHLKFSVNARKPELLVLSVPYDRGWKVTCDGKRIDTQPVMQILQGINIPEGSHQIELKYIPAGTLPGVIASLAGIIMFVFLCMRGYRRFDIEEGE